ncbi:LysR family transcriptional regulator [Aliivibrio kagoshimensis]|uniref:LysR family transcriptional regulator n=1 Tax=Aliivibrio kagoshimensis TaxID=2910230 RepID=UPI003D1236C8
MSVNPIWLHTFRTLIDVGHFTQTADKLYMTQPGVSQHIKKLEQHCGHMLIKRFNKSFELTEQGRLVYQYALQVAKDEEALLASLNFDNPHAGECQVACSGSLALLLYPKLLTLQQQYPELSIHLEAAPNQKILNDIERGSMDFGVVTYAPNSSQFHTKIIGSEPLCLILPKRYEGQTIDIEKLKACGVIMHPDALHYLALYFEQSGSQAFSLLRAEDLPTVGYVNQLSQILLPISQGIGFTVLPQSAIAGFAHPDQLYLHQPQRQVIETLYAVSKRNRTLPTRYQTLLPLLEHSLANKVN